MTLIYIILFLLPVGMAHGVTTLNLPAAQIAGVTERPSLEASRQSIIVSQKDEQRLFGKLFPQISGSANALLATTSVSDVSSSNETACTLSLQGSQILFNLPGKIQGQIAALTTQRSTYQYQASSHEVRYTVSTHFLQAWLLQTKAPLIAALATYTDELEKNNNNLRQLNNINAITWSATAATIAQNRATIAGYPLAAASSLQMLRQSMGAGYVHTSEITELSYDLTHPLPERKEIQKYIDLAYANRPELKDKDLAMQQQELTAKSYRANYLPTISMQGNLSTTPTGANVMKGQSASIGVSLQWNFFDGTQSVRSAEIADANKLRVSFEKQELKNNIATAIINTYNTLCTNEKMVEVARARVAAQEALFSQTTAAFAAGTVDALVLAKDAYDYAAALHDLRAQQVTLHTNWQTLAWQCGYPTSGVFNES